jgi:hypothetical protein
MITLKVEFEDSECEVGLLDENLNELTVRGYRRLPYDSAQKFFEFGEFSEPAVCGGQAIFLNCGKVVKFASNRTFDLPQFIGNLCISFEEGPAANSFATKRQSISGGTQKQTTSVRKSNLRSL